MKLNAQLASKIVKEARSSLDEHFIIVDTDSRIIASSDPGRIGILHEGARMAIAEDRIIFIQEEDVASLSGVKPGINMPIKYNNEVIGVIGITGNPESVRPFADIIRRLTELFIKEAIHTEQLASRNRGIESFIYEWMFRENIDEAFKRRGDILGISTTDAYGVVLCRLEPLKQSNVTMETNIADDPNIQEWIRTLFTSAFNPNKDVMIRWEKDCFLFLIQNEHFQVNELKRTFIQWHHKLLGNKSGIFKVGIGRTCESQVLIHSFKEAQKALNTTNNSAPVILYENLRLELLLQEIPPEAQQAYLNVTLQRLEKESTLINTLKAYLEHNLSVSQAAVSLHVHVNTLNYRLMKLAELTGIDVKSTEGVVLAYLALKLWKEKESY